VTIKAREQKKNSTCPKSGVITLTKQEEWGGKIGEGYGKGAKGVEKNSRGKIKNRKNHNLSQQRSHPCGGILQKITVTRHNLLGKRRLWSLSL